MQTNNHHLIQGETALPPFPNASDLPTPELPTSKVPSHEQPSSRASLTAPQAIQWSDVCITRKSEEVLEQARRFACISEPVLIIGECGTGKNALAHHIFSAIEDDQRRLAIVSCSSLNPTPRESTDTMELSLRQFLELGKTSSSVTWIFDRVDEVPFDHQGSFLQVVNQIISQPRTIPSPSIISTAASSILESIQCGQFRKDLFYQLSVLQIEVPPLRERLQDLDPLIRSFLTARVAKDASHHQFTAGAIGLLAQHNWPGNLVELRNVVSRVTALAQQRLIDEEQLLRCWRVPPKQDGVDLSGLSLEDAETHLILDAIERFDGNKTAAASQLGITTRTLHNKVRKFRQLGLIS